VRLNSTKPGGDHSPSVNLSKLNSESSDRGELEKHIPADEPIKITQAQPRIVITVDYGKRKFLPKNSPTNIFKLLPNASFIGSGYRKPISTITRVQQPIPDQNNTGHADDTPVSDPLTSTKITLAPAEIGANSDGPNVG